MFFNKLKGFLIDYDYYNQISSNTREIKIHYNKYKKLIFSENEFERLITRSIIHYKLQSKSRSIIKLIISEFLSFLLFLPLIFFIFIFRNKKINQIEIQKNIFINENNINYNLPNKFKNHRTINKLFYFLKLSDLKLFLLISIFYFKNFGFFLIFQFLIKVFFRIAEINYISKKYKFKNLILMKEYDFSISFITFLCRQKKIKVNIIQHGDVYLSTQNCFFEIDNYYSWDKDFEKILNQNKVYCSNFEVFNPFKKIINNIEYKKNICILIPSKLHFSNSQDKLIKNLKIVIDELKKVKKLGYKIYAKPHPRINQNLEIKLLKKNNIKILNKNLNINIVSDMNNFLICTLSSGIFYFIKKKRNIMILENKFIKPIKSYYPIFKYKKTIIIKNNKILKYFN